MDQFLNKHRIDNVPCNSQLVTACTPEWMEEIKEQILISPHVSVRKPTSHVHGSRSSVPRMLCRSPFEYIIYIMEKQYCVCPIRLVEGTVGE